jgi:hypothetical protein
MKRLSITGAVLVVAVALSGLIGSATASAAFQCLLISNPVAGGGLNGKEGAYTTSKCETPTPHLLEGDWILAEPLVKTVEDLWCALISLVLPGEISGEDGYYEDSKCTKKNKTANASDYTEVIVPPSGESTKILPEPSAGAPLTDTMTQPAAGHWLSVGKSEITCKKSSGSESFTSANEGTGNLTLEECTSSLSTKCTSSGQATGTIKAEGEMHFWLALLMITATTSTLVGALVFLYKEVPIVCENTSKTIKIEVVVVNKSCIAANVLPTSMNALVSSVHEEFTEYSSGETQILSVLPAGGTSEIACLPTLKTNGGTAELFALSALFLVKEFKKSGAAITIELMNP